MIKRKITLLLENPTDVEKTRISEWCSVSEPPLLTLRLEEGASLQ